MTESPNKDNVQERPQAVPASGSSRVSQKELTDAFATVPWIEFNISAKPNHQALAAHPAVQHLVGNSARAALNDIATKVTERIVSSMRGIVEKTVQEVIENDIPHHVAASLQDTFKEHPVPAEPVAVTGFQRLSARSLGGSGVRQQLAAISPSAPPSGAAPSLAPKSVGVYEVPGGSSKPGVLPTEAKWDVTPHVPPSSSISNQVRMLQSRFVETERVGTSGTDTRVQDSADKTGQVQGEGTTDAPAPASVIEDSTQGVEAPPEADQSGLEKAPDGAASPSPATAPLGVPNSGEEPAETVIETKTQGENDAGVEASHEEAVTPVVAANNNVNVEQVKGNLDSIGKTGGQEEAEPASAAAEDKVENQVEEVGGQAGAEEVDEQQSSPELGSPQLTPEPESPLVPDISTASWIWLADESSSQQNSGSAGARVFRKVAHVPLTVDSVIIDIAFPQTGQYTVHANGVVVGQLDGGHENESGVKVRRFKASLDKPANTVVIAVRTLVEGNVAEKPGAENGENSKTEGRAGLILAGVLWMSRHFDGRTYRIKTNASWKSGVVASGEDGFTKPEFKAGLKKVTVVGPYGAEPWGDFHDKGQVAAESEQLSESDKQFLVQEVAQESKEGGENARGE